MTEKLFYSDPYMREFDAEVTDVLFEKDVWKVAMDRTAFYPEGGGQPADRGVILKTAPGDPAAYDDKNLREAAAPGSFPSGSKHQNRAESADQISVTDVHEKDGIIWHTLAWPATRKCLQKEGLLPLRSVRPSAGSSTGSAVLTTCSSTPANTS